MNEAIERLPTVTELLTQQFYDWELRGRGWTVWDQPVELEPPFRPFEGHYAPRIVQDDGVEETRLSRFARKLLNGFRRDEEAASTQPNNEIVEPRPNWLEGPIERV